jgi:hypothetical protein
MGVGQYKESNLILNLCKLLAMELATFKFEFKWTEYCMMAFSTNLVLFITNLGDNLFSVRTAQLNVE